MLVSMIAEGLGLVLGSLFAALGVSILGWWLGKTVNHPEWGLAAMPLLLIALLFLGVVHGPFPAMMLIFLLVASGLAWSEGEVWRMQRAASRRRNMRGAT